jgi:lytic murein transglycosylase
MKHPARASQTIFYPRIGFNAYRGSALTRGVARADWGANSLQMMGLPMWKTALKWAAVLLVILMAGPAMAARCRNTGSFERWLDGFKKDALAQGILPRVLAEASSDLTFDPAIIRRDQGQAVFNLTFLQFSDRLVGGYRVPRGRAELKKHAAIFAKVEKAYGVPGPVLVAFWGLESDFGAMFGKYKILTALTTLAYDCRRPDFFRDQLISALRIVQRGDQRVSDMIGDWAGEFGGMQFTATDYLKNAIDFDGDGRRDLIHSIPDTLASAANFLVNLGWKRGEPWLQEVRVPQNLPWQEADLNIQHPRSQWVTWGVRAAHGKLPRDKLPASLVLPMGRHGPAFLAYPNFKAFLGWNSAYVYSLTVAYFATRLDGAPVVDHAGAKTVAALSTPQMMELQRLLNKHGFEAGEIDGKLGSATREAVKQAQIKAGLPADSYPTADLIAKLRGG